MGEIRQNVEKVLLFIAAFASQEQPLEWGRERAVYQYGPILYESETFRFDHFTRYYAEEMGETLYKRFWAFEKFVDPSELSSLKQQTNRWEKECPCAETDRRPLNLDPGYIDLGKLVLASTKDFGHRIYLKDGIFAETTLIYTKKQWTPLPWTYSDYKTEAYHKFFTQCRDYLAKERRCQFCL